MPPVRTGAGEGSSAVRLPDVMRKPHSNAKSQTLSYEDTGMEELTAGLVKSRRRARLLLAEERRQLQRVQKSEAGSALSALAQGRRTAASVAQHSSPLRQMPITGQRRWTFWKRNASCGATVTSWSCLRHPVGVL